MRNVRKCMAAVLLAAASVFAAGCAAVSGSYHDDSYCGNWSGMSAEKEPIQTSAAERYPVIFIHGLLGSKLVDTADEGKIIWGDFSLRSMSDRALERLILPYDEYAAGAKSALKVAGILDCSPVQLLGFRWNLNNYKPMLDLFKNLGYRAECTPEASEKCGANLFVFVYDWRKSIAENAAGLARFVEEKKEYLEGVYQKYEHLRDREVRFDLIGHSMGGLIARYYVQYGAAQLGRKGKPLPGLTWYGARNVRKVVMIASPNGGYADTLVELVNGLQLAPGSPVIPAGVLGSFVSYYQMLPVAAAGAVRYNDSNKNVDVLDVEIWKKYQWGLLKDSNENRRMLAKMYPDLNEDERREKALQYLSDCLDSAARFQLAMAKPMGLPPEPVRFYCFASAGKPTAARLSVDEKSGAVKTALLHCGDGKVTLDSAHWDYRNTASPMVWQSVITLDGGHMGIMRSAIFARNLAHVLICEP